MPPTDDEERAAGSKLLSLIEELIDAKIDKALERGRRSDLEIEIDRAREAILDFALGEV